MKPKLTLKKAILESLPIRERQAILKESLKYITTNKGDTTIQNTAIFAIKFNPISEALTKKYLDEDYAIVGCEKTFSVEYFPELDGLNPMLTGKDAKNVIENAIAINEINILKGVNQ